ncbi:MAG: hypothetical protein NZZ41_02585 [Candidatus Dojkabacteria bacterium]|nr:hypothetical protein [Candidatus Dojkabacteria bacterium]
MNISHLLETLNNAQIVRQSNYKHFRAYVQSGILRFNTDWAEEIGIARKIGFDYGLTVNKELVFVEVPLRYVNSLGNLTQTRPNPVVGNARLLSSADEKLKGLLKRPEMIQDLKLALLSNQDNVYSFDFELLPKEEKEVVFAYHRGKVNEVVKREGKTYFVKLTNVDYVKKSR